MRGACYVKLLSLGRELEVKGFLHGFVGQAAGGIINQVLINGVTRRE